MTDQPTPPVGDGSSLEARLREYIPSVDLNEFEELLRDAADALAAQARELEMLRGIQHAHEVTTQAIAEAVGEGHPRGPYWADGVRFLQQLAETAEAELARLRAVLTRIAAHDGQRWNYDDDITRQDSPQDIARAALSTATDDPTEGARENQYPEPGSRKRPTR